MNRKLTLKLDGAVIERAKRYATNNHDSVSGMVARYLKAITEEDERVAHTTTQMVQEVSGVISIPDQYDEKEEFRKAIVEKYYE